MKNNFHNGGGRAISPDLSKCCHTCKFIHVRYEDLGGGWCSHQDNRYDLIQPWGTYRNYPPIVAKDGYCDLHENGETP
jgi:hypothetical protein